MAVAENVRVGVTGTVNMGTSGATLPTTTVAALTNFTDVGYISEDGVTQAINADVNDIKAWQNGDTVRKVQTSHDLTYHFVMLETNTETLEAYYGPDNLAGGVVEITGDQLPRLPWVLDVIDGDEVVRIVIPDGQITERGDVAFKNDDATGYEVTLTAYPDDNGVKAYQYHASLASA